MELKQIEILINKYFEGQTSISEEKQLKAYFLSENVAPHLEQYKNLFDYYQKEKEVEFSAALPLPPRKRNYAKWIGVAASFTLLFVVLFFFNKKDNEDLGTFSSPEEAFVETQKALQMVAVEVNKGKESIAVLNEYEKTKKTIFK